MKVLITGGAGFIGGHAVRHFVESGDEVLNVDKLTYASSKDNIKASPFVQLDVCDRYALKTITARFSPDYFLHFAAETHVDNSIASCDEFVRSNVGGVASVLSTCNELGIKLCHISTDEVYGPAGDDPFVEEDRLNPMNPYSATKAAGDMLVKSFHNTYKMPYLIVRPSNNYGPGQHEEKFIPKLLKCIKTGDKFPLYGDGSQVREWTYAKDTVKVIRRLLVEEKTWASTYNLTSGVSLTNLQVIEKVIDIYNGVKGKSLRVEDVTRHVEDRKGHDKKYFISPEKLNSVFRHEYLTFESGLSEIING